MPELLDAFAALARRDPDRPAVSVLDRDGRASGATRGELLALATRRAAEIARESGRRAILPFAGPRSVPAVAHLLGCLLAGRGFSFLDPRLPESAAARLADRLHGAADRRDGEAIGTCLFTSGSTGAPKGVLVSRSDLFARAAAEADWFGLSEEDVLLGLLPLSFDVGLNQLLAGLAAGAEVVFLASVLPGDIFDATENRRVSGISAVPSIWRGMLAVDARFEGEGPHRALRYVTISGGDLSVPHLARMEALAGGAGIFKTYGQTEAFRGASLRPEEFRGRPASVGRPFPGVRLAVVRPDGNPAGPGEEGEIRHAGLGVFSGYLGEPDPPRTLVPEGPDPRPGAVMTGDFGSLDAEGYLTIRGRKDGMLKIGGTRIYPAEVEGRIESLPGVAEAAVVRAGERRGEPVLAAFVVPAPRSELDPAALRRALREVVPPPLVPAVVRVIDTMPCTTSGKADRVLLERRAAGG